MRSVSYIKVDKIKGILQNFVVVTSKAYFTYVVARVLLWDAAFYKAKLALKATAKKTKDDTDEPEQEEGDGTDNNTAFFIISTLRLILESNAYEYDIASLDFSLSLSLSSGACVDSVGQPCVCTYAVPMYRSLPTSSCWTFCLRNYACQRLVGVCTPCVQTNTSMQCRDISVFRSVHVRVFSTTPRDQHVSIVGVAGATRRVVLVVHSKDE
jgi:hypothetical protein